MKKLGLLVCMLWLGGCSSLMPGSSDKGTPEEIVAERALQRYQAMMAGDYRKAYKFMTPGYRVLNTLEDFQKSNIGVAQWGEVEIGRVTCSENDCRAGVSFEYRREGVTRRGTGPTGGAVRDVWNQIDGQWYFTRME